MFDPYALNIYTDGSCFRNPGHNGGLAGIAMFPDSHNQPDEVIFKVGYLQTTNNRMELLAAIKALDYIAQNLKKLDINRAIIYSDSSYVIDHQFICEEWKKANWRNSANRPVENNDLWKIFLAKRHKIPIRIELKWIKGKSIPITKQVDKLAKTAAKSAFLTIDAGFRSGKVSRTLIAESDGATLFPANGENIEIRVYKYVLIAKDEYKVVFEAAENTSDNQRKYFAYINASLRQDVHRHQFYTATFNDNKKYPKITKLDPITKA